MLTTRIIDDPPSPSEVNDFVIRKRPYGFHLSCVFAVASVVIIVAEMMSRHADNVAIFIGMVGVIMTMLAWFITMFAVRNRDLVMATEFINTMLASAAQFSFRFCVITKPNNMIAYADMGFQEFFPGARHGGISITNLLMGSVSGEAGQNLSRLLESGRTGRVVAPFREASGKLITLVISIDMLARPRGYRLIRGREYIENRNQASNLTLALMTQTLSALPGGVLIADADGRITHANRMLEEWLGYPAGGMTSPPLTLDQLYRTHGGGQQDGRVVFGNYEGEVWIRSKNGDQAVVYIRQTQLLGDNRKPIGFSVFINTPDSKKN